MNLPILRSERIFLTLPKNEDVYDFLNYRSLNKDHLRPWEPKSITFEHPVKQTRIMFRKYRREYKNRKGIFCLIRLNDDHELVGTIHLSNIIRGPFQSAFLGYQLSRASQGNGYMTEALNLMVQFAFEDLGLHRIEANVMPRNIRSKKLLENCGFMYEGISRQYLQIAGTWQDHEHYVILNQNNT